MAIYLSLTGRAILLHNRAKNIVFSHAPYFISIQSLMSWHMKLSPRSQMLIITIIIFIPITQQPEQDRWAENQPTAGLSSLNEYENGMRKSETELSN